MEKVIFIVKQKKGKIKMYKEIVICIIVVILIVSMDLISNSYTKEVLNEINENLGIL